MKLTQNTHPEARVAMDAPGIKTLDSTEIGLPVALFLTGLICIVASDEVDQEWSSQRKEIIYYHD